VERLWNVFGDNLTAKQHSMGKVMLAELVYARMNMYLLQHDHLHDDDADLSSNNFKSIFEAVCDRDDQQEVQEAARCNAMGSIRWLSTQVKNPSGGIVAILHSRTTQEQHRSLFWRV
jgi:hypothetical protein